MNYPISKINSSILWIIHGSHEFIVDSPMEAYFWIQFMGYPFTESILNFNGE